MKERTHWGKAGQRLTAEEARERARKRIAARNRVAVLARQDEDKAFKLWRAGQMRPFRITQALDMGKHYGPEVDRACGVEEPTVDLWEAGQVYPEWEQVQALCRLTGVLPMFFMQGEPLDIQTSMQYHQRGGNYRAAPLVQRFTNEAIRYLFDGPDSG